MSGDGRSPIALLDRPFAAPALAAIVFAAAAVQNAVSPLGDQDPFWLAAAGRLVWRTGRVPHENTFSFVAPHSPWICHEIGFAVVYAKALAWLGPGAFALAGILGASTTLAVALRFAAREVTHRVTLALVALLLVAGVPLFYSPPAFASLGAVAGMTSLAFGGEATKRRMAACVGLEWLWALLHGSFPLGVALLVVAAIERARERRRLLVTAALAAGVTLLNPYGLALHGLVASYAGGGDAVSRVINAHIIEFLPLWKAPRALGPFDVPVLALLAGLSVTAVARGRDRARAALVLLLCAAALLHVRHVLLAVVVGVPLLARRIDALLPAGELDFAAARRSALAVVAPGALLGAAVFAVVCARRPRQDWLGPNLGGPAAIAMVDALPRGARVYAPFRVSALVIWYGFPRDVRVLYDPRNDCYPADVALAMLPLEYDEAAERAAAATVARFGATDALARTGSTVEASFRASKAWRPVRTEGGLAWFARD